MVYFIYKFYYVFFLHFSKSKSSISWDNSILVITVSVACVFLVLYFAVTDIFGLGANIFATDKERLSPVDRKIKDLVIFIPYLTIIWYLIKFTVLNLAKASKEDGRSEIYTFEPTKQDKIIYWIIFISSACSVFILAGIKDLLGHYD